MSSIPSHIAGIGASAGGLEAMLPMFARMQKTGRVAYVVAQHMAHDGHSDLVVRLIGRESALPVELAAEGTRLRPDNVYVIPAGNDGRVRGGTLTLSDPAPEHLSTPSVNALLASIAESSGGGAIGIVLSGTGSDGVVGCRAIKAAGGMILAQDPQEAKFDGMPSAAIDAKLVDRVLPAEKIGETLAALFPGTPEASRTDAPSAVYPLSARTTAPDGSESGITGAAHGELEQLLRQVFEATGIDFSSYKEETLLRRLDKRKATLGAVSAAAYQTLIRRDPQELRTLQHLFLVSVSSFFRDRESFRALERSLAGALAEKRENEAIRVWVPGCASGEEAYTLAMILHELLDQYRRRHPVAITATDLNPDALAMAREGVYRQTALREMDLPLRERHFVPRGQHFEVKPGLKACVRFEQRDVLGGAPAGEHDLVSCRNLLIYLKSRLQDELIKSFHQALRAQGLLFIGQSESLGFVGNALFAPVDHYHRLFRRRH
ncbi:MAG: chemotaxis protein [Proteobacteria bacterium]|nr:chemotaxis protein [Pseudomonadota bacterium]